MLLNKKGVFCLGVGVFNIYFLGVEKVEKFIIEVCLEEGI